MLKLIYVFVLILPAVVVATGAILYLRRDQLGWFKEREHRRREREIERLEAESARLDELIRRRARGLRESPRAGRGPAGLIAVGLIAGFELERRT